MALLPRARRDVAVATLALGLCLLLFPRAFLRGESFFERDLNFDWYLRVDAVAQALEEGSWPLWDRSVAFGQPLLADPGTEVLYPATWLALPVPRRLGYTVFVVAHLLLTAVGTARLAGALGAGPTGSVVAALFWTASGPLQSSLNLRQHLAGVAWMPWVLLAVDRCVRRPGRSTGLSLAAVGAVQVLAGSADVCAMTWTLGAAWAGFRLVGRRGRRAGPALAGLAAAAVLAAGLTAVAWWPAADVLARSPRQDLPEDIRTAWSVPPDGLWRFVTPLDPDRVPFSVEAWQALYDRPEVPFLDSLYLGLPILLLGAAAIVSRRDRRGAVFLAVAAASGVVLAMGPHAPFYPLLTDLVPLLRIFRYPSKITLVVALAAALIAGLGAGALARRRLGARTLGVLGAGTLLAAGAALLAGAAWWGTWSAAASPALAAGSGALIVLGAGGLLRPRLLLLAVAGLAVGDLLLVHADMNATGPASLLFEPPPTVALVDRSEGRRLYVYDYHSVAGTSARLLGRTDPYQHVPTPPGWDPRRFAFAARQRYLPPPSGALFGLEGSYDMDIRGLYSRPLNDLTFFLRHVEGTPVHTSLLRMGAVGTVLSLHDAGLEDLPVIARVPGLFPDEIRVRRVPGALPRSWVVGGARVADERAAFETLADPAFDPGREVLLADGAARPVPPGFAGTSEVRRLAPDRVTLEVEASTAGWVVLADAFDPGWRATVDGAPAVVERANLAFRAVAVAAGRHRVEMVYRPAAVTRGLTLSGLALLVAVAAARRGRGPRPARGR